MPTLVLQSIGILLRINATSENHLYFDEIKGAAFI